MTLYEKYGGFDFFHDLIYKLYLDMFDHPEISYHFVGVDIEKLSLHQAQFFCRALGADIKYEGRPIYQVHKDLNISEFQFDEIAKSFKNIFVKSGIEPDDVEFIMAFIGKYKKAVTSCKLSTIDIAMIPFYNTIDKIEDLGRKVVRFLKFQINRKS